MLKAAEERGLALGDEVVIEQAGEQDEEDYFACAQDSDGLEQVALQFERLGWFLSRDTSFGDDGVGKQGAK